MIDGIVRLLPFCLLNEEGIEEKNEEAIKMNIRNIAKKKMKERKEELLKRVMLL